MTHSMPNLKTLRERRGLTQAALAAHAGITPYMVSYLEAGKRHGTLPTALKIAAALGVSLDDLTTTESEVNRAA